MKRILFFMLSFLIVSILSLQNALHKVTPDGDCLMVRLSVLVKV